jgi:hypothetical protein
MTLIIDNPEANERAVIDIQYIVMNTSIFDWVRHREHKCDDRDRLYCPNPIFEE